MVHWPQSVVRYLFSFLIVLGIGYVVVSARDTLSSPWLWAPIAIVFMMSLVAFAGIDVWKRHESGRGTGSFSFAEVVARRRAEEALRGAESTG